MTDDPEDQMTAEDRAEVAAHNKRIRGITAAAIGIGSFVVAGFIARNITKDVMRADAVRQVEEQTRKQLPKSMDSVTILDEFSIERSRPIYAIVLGEGQDGDPLVFHYHYKVTASKDEMINYEAIARKLACADPQMRSQVTQGNSYVYAYSDKSGAEAVTFVIDRCQ